MTTISYYLSSSGKNPVKEFIDSLNIKQIRKIARLFKAIQTYGTNAAIPHIRKLTNTPFYELRILGEDNIRLFYIWGEYDTMIILHGNIKKSQKTSTRDLHAVFRAYYDLRNKP